METYRMSSRLEADGREYMITTVNAVTGAVESTIQVDGLSVDLSTQPTPESCTAEELLSLVKLTHAEKQRELETLLDGAAKASASGDSGLLYHVGTAFYYKGLFDEARQMLERVLRLNPTHHQSANYLGLTLGALGRFEEAVEAAGQAANLRPKFADYRNNLGEALLGRGDVVRATAEFEQAIEINLYYADAYLNHGIARLQAAIGDYDFSTWNDVKPRILDRINKAALTDTALRGDLLDSALEQIERVDLNAALITLRSLRAAKREEKRREFASFHMKFVLHPEWVSEEVVAERIRFLQAELKKNPSYVDLMTELARCFFEQAKLTWRRGLAQYEQAMKLNPGLSDIERDLERAREIAARMDDQRAISASVVPSAATEHPTRG